jgi:hypothetical protein
MRWLFWEIIFMRMRHNQKDSLCVNYRFTEHKGSGTRCYQYSIEGGRYHHEAYIVNPLLRPGHCPWDVAFETILACDDTTIGFWHGYSTQNRRVAKWHMVIRKIFTHHWFIALNLLAWVPFRIFFEHLFCPRKCEFRENYFYKYVCKCSSEVLRASDLVKCFVQVF